MKLLLALIFALCLLGASVKTEALPTHIGANCIVHSAQPNPKCHVLALVTISSPLLGGKQQEVREMAGGEQEKGRRRNSSLGAPVQSPPKGRWVSYSSKFLCVQTEQNMPADHMQEVAP